MNFLGGIKFDSIHRHSLPHRSDDPNDCSYKKLFSKRIPWYFRRGYCITYPYYADTTAVLSSAVSCSYRYIVAYPTVPLPAVFCLYYRYSLFATSHGKPKISGYPNIVRQLLQDMYAVVHLVYGTASIVTCNTAWPSTTHHHEGLGFKEKRQPHQCNQKD